MFIQHQATNQTEKEIMCKQKKARKEENRKEGKVAQSDGGRDEVRERERDKEMEQRKKVQ